MLPEEVFVEQRSPDGVDEGHHAGVDLVAPVRVAVAVDAQVGDEHARAVLERVAGEGGEGCGGAGGVHEELDKERRGFECRHRAAGARLCVAPR